jgi:hypothetical protein
MSFNSFLRGEMKRAGKDFDREAKEQWKEIQSTFDFMKEVAKEKDRKERER